jgi:hypothetical protein
LALRRRIADAVDVMGRRQLAIVVGIVSLAGIGFLVARTGRHTFQVAATPDWRYLLAGLAICVVVQPLRALAWTSTVRSPVGFRAMYAASSVGSFLDTVLPGRMGEASKVAVLKVAAGHKWPGFSRAGGSLLCAHLLEMIAFVLVGAGSAFFLPIPQWAKITMLVGLPLAAGGLVLVSVMHKRLNHRHRRGAALHGRHRPREHDAVPAGERRHLPGGCARRARDGGPRRLDGRGRLGLHAGRREPRDRDRRDDRPRVLRPPLRRAP